MGFQWMLHWWIDARLHNPVSGDLVSFHLIFVQVSTFSDILFLFCFSGKLFDAVEQTSRDILQSTSVMTKNVVGHRLFFLISLFMIFVFKFLSLGEAG
jgi:hypothetical protein